jgi:hypothetical protein
VKKIAVTTLPRFLMTSKSKKEGGLSGVLPTPSQLWVKSRKITKLLDAGRGKCLKRHPTPQRSSSSIRMVSAVRDSEFVIKYKE